MLMMNMKNTVIRKTLKLSIAMILSLTALLSMKNGLIYCLLRMALVIILIPYMSVEPKQIFSLAGLFTPSN
jgi:hypothetical protein